MQRTHACLGHSRRFVPCLVILVCLISFNRAAAQTASAEIVYTKGASLAIVRGTREIPLVEAVGQVLERGDILQTGRSSQAEILIMPRRILIKVAENSTVRLSGLGDAESAGLLMLYGRARVLVPEDDMGFELRAGQTAAFSKGGDIGMDVILPKTPRAGQTRVEVYCLSGQADVSASAKDAPPDDISRESLGPGRMAESRVEDGRLILFQTALKKDTEAYWAGNPFLSEYAASIAVAGSAPADPKSAVPPRPSLGGAPSTEGPAPTLSAAPKAEAPGMPGPAPEGGVQGSAVSSAAAAVSVDNGSSGKRVGQQEEAMVAPPALAQEGASRAPEFARARRQLFAKNVLLGVGSLLCLAGLGCQGLSLYFSESGQYGELTRPLLETGVSLSGVGGLIGLIGLTANPSLPRK